MTKRSSINVKKETFEKAPDSKRPYNKPVLKEGPRAEKLIKGTTNPPGSPPL